MEKTCYVGQQSKKYTPLKLLAKGGEGEIFTIEEDSSLVIKIYKDTYVKEKELENNERRSKLLHMMQNPPIGSLNEFIAWPLDILDDENGIFSGFVMNKISDIDSIDVLYQRNIGTKTKSIELPWAKKVKVAKNLCSVVHAVHKAGHTIGDFNPLNIGINEKTLKVILLDTDSYHIVTSNQTFRCGVGKTEYLPAEIQKKMIRGNDLKNAPLPTFTIESDYFALAIHIFNLLMGSSPYTFSKIPSKRSVVKPSIEDNIIQGQTAYFNLPEGMSYPLYSPPVIILPDHIQKLIVRAFILGTQEPNVRPSEDEWYNALEMMEKDLTQCNKDTNHQFPKHNSECSWCLLQNRLNTTQILKPISTPKVTPPPAPTYTPSSGSSYSSGFSLADFIDDFFMEYEGWAWVIIIVLIGLIIPFFFGIFGIFSGGFNNFFPELGSGYVFLWNGILWLGNVILTIVIWIIAIVWYIVSSIGNFIVSIFN